MQAAAHFDPFSQALCVNLASIRGLANPAGLVNAMLQPKREAILDTLKCVHQLDEDERLPGVLLVSSVWHEKRHFSDLLLTNFGAYRTRLNFQLMFAGPPLVREAFANGKLAVPITAYADEVRLQSLGFEPPYPPNALRMGENLAKRYNFHELDKLTLEPGLSLGATSCLEALAYMSQLASIEFYFGKETCAEIQALLQDAGLSKVYTWVQHFGRDLGLIEDMGPGWPEHARKVHRVAPLLFMALCGRAGNLQGEGGSSGGSLAAQRLPELVQAMVDRKLNLQGMDGAESWDALDRMHREVWGRSCADELEADLERDESLLRLMAAQDGDCELVEAFEEYTALRQRMVAAFRREPHRFVDPYVFPWELLPYLQPRPRVDDPRGQFLPAPPGWSTVYHGSLPEKLVRRGGNDLTPWSRWWWSITPDDWEVPAEEWGLNSVAWVDAMKHWAPLGKFLLSGRAAQDCLGPELRDIEQVIARNCELLIEAHAASAATPDPAGFWFVHGGAIAKCDFSGEALSPGDTVCISPWRIHLSERNLDFVLQRYGPDNPLAPSLILKDWSVWVVHRRFDAELEA